MMEEKLDQAAMCIMAQKAYPDFFKSEVNVKFEAAILVPLGSKSKKKEIKS